jgi:hypothetical protein
VRLEGGLASPNHIRALLLIFLLFYFGCVSLFVLVAVFDELKKKFFSDRLTDRISTLVYYNDADFLSSVIRAREG